MSAYPPLHKAMADKSVGSTEDISWEVSCVLLMVRERIPRYGSGSAEWPASHSLVIVPVEALALDGEELEVLILA